MKFLSFIKDFFKKTHKNSPDTLILYLSYPGSEKVPIVFRKQEDGTYVNDDVFFPIHKDSSTLM